MASESKVKMPVQVWIEMSDGSREPVLAPGLRLRNVHVGTVQEGETWDEQTLTLEIVGGWEPSQEREGGG